MSRTKQGRRSHLDAALSSSEPGGRPPAPGALRLVQEFLNTNDIEGRSDELATPASLRSWLLRRAFELDGLAADAPGVARVIEAREALRMLILARDDRADAANAASAKACLHEVATKARFALTLEPLLWGLEPTSKGVDRALGVILARVVEGMTNGTWGRLKACRRDSCQWVFWDDSRSRTGAWCDMSVCGNRSKAVRFRRRHARRPRSATLV
jgi:predicted RNA-binding Zn ribbon-like protein